MAIKYLILFLMLTLLASVLSAQSYDFTVGARLGAPFAVSAKKFIAEKGAIEGYIGFRNNAVYDWFSISGAYQHQQTLSIQGVDNLEWYFGGGATLLFWDYKDEFIGNDYGSTTFGIQGYLGIEYIFPNSPLTISVDWIPTIFFNSYIDSFGAGYGALALRYILK